MIRWLLFLLGLSCPLLAAAQGWQLSRNYTDAQAGNMKFSPIPDSLLSVYRPKADLDLEQAIRNEKRFRPEPDTLHIRSGEAVWLRATCTNTEKGPVRYLFEVDPAYHPELFYEIRWPVIWSEVNVYVLKGDSLVQEITTSNQLLAAEKPVRDQRNLFWLDFEAGEQKQLFIRLTSQRTRERPALSLRIIDPEHTSELNGFTFRGYYRHLKGGPFSDLLYAQAIHSLEFVIDSTENFTLPELKQKWDKLAHFFRPQDLRPAKKFVLWCRFTLINPDSSARYLLFEAAEDYPEVDVFLPESGGHYRMVKTGRKIPNAKKVIPHPLNLVEFTIAALDTVQIYLKCQPIPNERNFLNNIFYTGITLLNPSDLMTESRIKGLWKGFIMGVLFFQLLYFLLRSLLEKNRLELYYAVIIFGFSLLFAGLENYQNTFLALQILPYQSQAILSLANVVLAGGLFLFTGRYLNLRSSMPGVYRVQWLLLLMIIAFSVINIVQMEFMWGIDNNSFFFSLDFFLYAISFFCIALIVYVISVLLAHFRNTPYALNYLLAFSPSFLAIAFLIVNYVFFGNRSDSLFNLVYFGFIITSVLFAIVGAQRHNEMKKKEAQADSLIKLDQAKSEFYSNITHEFRTPLTVIMGLADSIPVNGRERELIKKNGQELLDLVQQLLDLSKAQSGLLQLKLTDNNVVPYLEYLIESFHTLAEKKDIDLRFICDDDEIIMAYDREKMKFIVSNLVSNAIKFTPKKGKVLISAKKAKSALVLKVRDTGIGLSQEELERVFDRFYQAASAKPSNGDQQGTGIGLALVKEVVGLLEGKITVGSEPNKGTTFRVILPLYPSKMTGKDLPPYSKKEEKPVLSKPTFVSSENENIALIVEDNDDVQYYIERILSAEYKVLKAYDGEEGLEIAIEVIPDIIISDVMMPKMDGYLLTEKLKEDPRTNHIPVILLTAKAAQEDKVKGLAGGADAYLTKPFHEEELKVRMNKLIENRRLLRESFAQKETFSPTEGHPDPFLVSLSEILEVNFADEDFGIKELAGALFLSRMQVHRKIKALTGISTSQYLNYFRLEKGKALLANEHLNVSEVAFSCGFGDPGYFGKLFAKRYGQSPQASRSGTKEVRGER